MVADLPGYGRSSCSPDADHHGSMSEVLAAVGHDQFAYLANVSFPSHCELIVLPGE